MHTRSVWSVLILAGLTCAVTAVPALAQQHGGYVGPPVSTCPEIVVSSSEAPLQLSRNRFSAKGTTDLVFHVLFHGKMDKDHVITLKVYTPHGHLYQTLDVPAAPGKGKTPMGRRRLAGYPYPVRIVAPHTLKYENGVYDSIDVRFPVAGSTIETSSLYGKWKVEVLMDGAKHPCPHAVTFLIVP